MLKPDNQYNQYNKGQSQNNSKSESEYSGNKSYQKNDRNNIEKPSK